MFDSLNLTAAQRHRRDEELLARPADFPGPVALERVFRGIVPRWASDAADRPAASGAVRDVGGRLERVGGRQA